MIYIYYIIVWPPPRCTKSSRRQQRWSPFCKPRSVIPNECELRSVKAPKKNNNNDNYHSVRNCKDRSTFKNNNKTIFAIPDNVVGKGIGTPLELLQASASAVMLPTVYLFLAFSQKTVYIFLHTS